MSVTSLVLRHYSTQGPGRETRPLSAAACAEGFPGFPAIQVAAYFVYPGGPGLLPNGTIANFARHAGGLALQHGPGASYRLETDQRFQERNK